MSELSHLDFLVPVMNAVPQTSQRAVGIALDCAIAFGALLGADGIAPGTPRDALVLAYEEKVKRLRVLTS